MRCTYLGILLPTKRMKLSTILCSWRFERVDVARNWRHPDGFDHAINVWRGVCRGNRGVRFHDRPARLVRQRTTVRIEGGDAERRARRRGALIDVIDRW